MGLHIIINLESKSGDRLPPQFPFRLKSRPEDANGMMGKALSCPVGHASLLNSTRRTRVC